MKKSFITSGPGVSLAWIIQKVNINTDCHKSYHHSILTVVDWICLYLNIMEKYLFYYLVKYLDW